MDDDFEPYPVIRADGEPQGQWESHEETVPNLEVRLGAIYALERIAQDSERDHIPIMETLCAYIRENAPASGAPDHGLGDWEDWPEDTETPPPDRTRQKREMWLMMLSEWADALPAPRVDVQAALSVIGRRGEERIAHERRQRRDAGDRGPGFRLDLRGVNLQRADLTGLDLARALLNGTRLDAANLLDARFEGADLREARLEAAHIMVARLEGADLRGARVGGADLMGASLEGADLREARLEGAKLGWAQLKRADLREARLEGASLMQTQLEGANLRSADFTDAKHLTQDHVNAAYGDIATILPDGIVMPDHWDNETIRPSEDDKKYQAWLAAGAPPGRPPQAPPG